MSNIDTSSCLPTVSILMSVYNGSAYLEQAIDSVLSQTYHDFEFLIADDGSTDSTLEILNRYSKADSRIKIYSYGRVGLTLALNKLASLAVGKYIARIDSDDIWLPSKLTDQINLFLHDQSIVLVGSFFYTFNESVSSISHYKLPTDNSSLSKLLTSGRGFIPHSSAIFKSESFFSCGFYTAFLRRAQDRDLWLKLSKVGTISVSPNYHVGIRKHDKQITALYRNEQFVFSSVALLKYWLDDLIRYNGAAFSVSHFDLFDYFISEPYEDLYFITNLPVVFKDKFNKLGVYSLIFFSLSNYKSFFLYFLYRFGFYNPYRRLASKIFYKYFLVRN